MVQTLSATGSLDDRDLERRVISYLVSHGIRAAQLEVQAQQGVLVMRGKVRSNYEKWLGVHCCRRVAGVVQLVDVLEVVDPQPPVPPVLGKNQPRWPAEYLVRPAPPGRY